MHVMHVMQVMQVTHVMRKTRVRRRVLRAHAMRSTPGSQC